MFGAQAGGLFLLSMAGKALELFLECLLVRELRLLPKQGQAEQG